jgi:hypothetical protein
MPASLVRPVAPLIRTQFVPQALLYRTSTVPAPRYVLLQIVLALFAHPVAWGSPLGTADAASGVQRAAMAITMPASARRTVLVLRPPTHFLVRWVVTVPPCDL